MSLKIPAVEHTFARLRDRNTTWLVPTGLVLVVAVTFGFLIPSLGFYQDDWHPIFYGYVRGLASLRELFLYDGRPFATLIYQLAFPIIGFQPLHWQILALTLRILTVLFTWLYLREVWPQYWRETGLAALLFAVYPLFSLQALSLIYTIHWTGFLLFSVSIWAMLRSLRQSRFALPLTLLALLTSASHLLLLEYFAGVELARPLLIYFLQWDEGGSFGERIRRVIKAWWPYLGLLLAFAIYRIFFLPGPERGSVGNEPVLIRAFFDSPFQTGLQLLQFALQDSTAVLYSAWQIAISPTIFDLSAPAKSFTLLLMIFSAVLVFLYISVISNSGSAEKDTSHSWPREAVLVGLVITVLGPLPAWLTNQSITTDNPLWSGRFGLASMVGASLVVVALIEGLIASRTARNAILSILIAVSIGWHVLNLNEYRRSWIKQTDFYWQLYWRAPYIEPGTPILSAGEVLPRMGDYPTSFALSTLYPESKDKEALKYYFFNLESDFATQIEDLLQGMTLRRVAYSSRFEGDSRDSLVISYDPEHYECLWVLRPQDQQIRALPEITREALPVSDLGRIQPGSPYARPVPEQIFGREPAHTWCYYFQKADLARQEGDWEEVVGLWEQAEARGYAPGNGVEYLPFIEGYAQVGEWEQAAEMSLEAARLPRVMEPALCATWQTLEQETATSPERQTALDQIEGTLCSTPGE